MTRQKLKRNCLNSFRTNPHPLNYLYISGGVSSPHPPKTIFLRRDILLVRYVGLRTPLTGTSLLMAVPAVLALPRSSYALESVYVCGGEGDSVCV